MALLVATVIAVCFVLPAEYSIDPTGLGKVMRLTRLAKARPISAAQAMPAAAGNAAALASRDRYYEGGYRSHTVTIPLAGGSSFGRSELEYKVRMTVNSALVYAWEVEGMNDPEEFYFDFHAEGGGSVGPGPTQVIEFKQATGLKSAGVVIAPISGIYGWYLQNQSEKPVNFRLKISGFYDLIAPGEHGNEARIVANKTDN